MLQLERAWRWSRDAEAKERVYHARECRAMVLRSVSVSRRVVVGWWWCGARRHARPATPSLIEVRAATWGEDRSARVMMVMGAEVSDDSMQWQQEAAVVDDGGALEAVMRLRYTEAADRWMVYTRPCFGPERVRPQKAGNGC